MPSVSESEREGRFVWCWFFRRSCRAVSPTAAISTTTSETTYSRGRSGCHISTQQNRGKVKGRWVRSRVQNRATEVMYCRYKRSSRSRYQREHSSPRNAGRSEGPRQNSEKVKGKGKVRDLVQSRGKSKGLDRCMLCYPNPLCICYAIQTLFAYVVLYLIYSSESLPVPSHRIRSRTAHGYAH